MDWLAILNSNALIAIVTGITGVAAFLVYRNQKNDSKRDAANIILLEIQGAERVLSQVSSDIGTSLPHKFLLPTENWSKYKYLFVRDFDRDEWDTVSEFYNNCRLYDEAVKYNSSLFQKNEEHVRANMLRVPAELFIKHLEKEEITDGIIEEVFSKASSFQDAYISKAASLFYNPQKPLRDAKAAYDVLNRNLSQTSIGVKLKKLAGLN